MTELIYEPTTQPPVAVSRLAAYEVRTDDLDRLVDYYEGSLNLVATARDEDAAYLAAGPDHHCVVIRRGDRDGRAALSFEITGGLDETAERLEAAGIPCERQSDPAPGIAAQLVLSEQGTGTPLRLLERQAPSGTASG